MITPISDDSSSSQENYFQGELEKIKKLKETSNILAIKYFDFDFFKSLANDLKLRLLKIMKSGLENPDSFIGCYAMFPNDYEVFKPFFNNVIADYHKVLENSIHLSDWSLENLVEIPSDKIFDVRRLGIKQEISMRIRICRNFVNFPLPGAMKSEERINMEKYVFNAIEKLIKKEEYAGHYYSLTPESKYCTTDFNIREPENYLEMVENHLMFKDMNNDSYLKSSGIANDWPNGRGCYISNDKRYIIWVGEEDHLRIICMNKGFLLNDVFELARKFLEIINKLFEMDFAICKDFGVITSCPTNIGTGMRASVHLPLPKLTKQGISSKLKKFVKENGLSLRGYKGEHTNVGPGGVCDISPSERFCITEAEILKKLYNGIKLLQEYEDS